MAKLSSVGPILYVLAEIAFEDAESLIHISSLSVLQTII